MATGVLEGIETFFYKNKNYAASVKDAVESKEFLLDLLKTEPRKIAVKILEEATVVSAKIISIINGIPPSIVQSAVKTIDSFYTEYSKRFDDQTKESKEYFLAFSSVYKTEVSCFTGYMIENEKLVLTAYYGRYGVFIPAKSEDLNEHGRIMEDRARKIMMKAHEKKSYTKAEEEKAAREANLLLAEEKIRKR